MKRNKTKELYQWIISPFHENNPLQRFSQASWQTHQEYDVFSPTETDFSSTQVIRLIWENSKSTHDIIDWIMSLTHPISLAKINRDTGLYCIEIILNSHDEQQKCQHIKAKADIEFFSYSTSLPKLTHSGLLVMDMDSTAIQIECIDELAKMAGVGDRVSQITERAMQGELDFEQSLRERVLALKGSSATMINELCTNLPLMPGLTSMVTELQSHGWHIAIASGGFIPFVNTLRDQLNLSAAFANTLTIENNIITGEVSGAIVDANFKAQVLQKLGDKWNIPYSQRLAIGDGANDIPMINSASFGIAYHGKNKLKNQANACIDKLDLQVLPYFLVK